ncbi:polysaccharide deacetylase family protein [Paucilactobacillus sp. N302-9]
MKDKSIWPQSYQSASSVTINLDGQYRWMGLYPDKSDSQLKALKVMGQNSIENGLPRMLAVLEQQAVKATFFVSGTIARHYPDLIKQIDNAGHELASFGDQNENYALLNTQQQEKLIINSKKSIENIVGHSIYGFRAPEGELTTQTLQLAKKAGYRYSSNLFSDIKPFQNKIGDQQTLLEIPSSWALNDLPYFIANFEPVEPAGQCRISNYDDVLNNWKFEIDGYRQLHGCSVFQLNSQASSTLGRLQLFKKLLIYLKQNSDIWLATCGQIAQQTAASEGVQ